MAWSYYAYFVGVILNAMATSPAEQVISFSPQRTNFNLNTLFVTGDRNFVFSQVICAVVFHCVAALFAWSYAMVIFTPPGFAPPSWHLSADQVASRLT